jgi:hypothetical protein
VTGAFFGLWVIVDERTGLDLCDGDRCRLFVGGSFESRLGLYVSVPYNIDCFADPGHGHGCLPDGYGVGILDGLFEEKQAQICFMAEFASFVIGVDVDGLDFGVLVLGPIWLREVHSKLDISGACALDGLDAVASSQDEPMGDECACTERARAVGHDGTDSRKAQVSAAIDDGLALCCCGERRGRRWLALESYEARNGEQ